MVAQKKGGAAGKQKQTKTQAAKPKSAKLFEEEFEMDDDDFDDDDAEMDSDESGDSDDAPGKGKKTPVAGAKTPGTRSAKKDVHVSFQLQDKTPTGQKAQMVRTPTPMVPKNKQGAQSLREQTLKKGMPGSPALKEFEGMKNSGSAKKEKNAAGGKPEKGVKRKSVEDDDEDDDDFEDDDDDLDEDDLDDDDDDDEDEEDDDDDDLDSDEEKAIVKKAKAALDRKQKNPKQENKKQAASPKKEQQKGAQTPGKKQQNKQQQQQRQTSPMKKEAKKPICAAAGEALAEEQKRREERDARTLFVRGFPVDVVEEELKSLTPDIVSVRIPSKKHQRRGGKFGCYAFIEFTSEAKAEENFKILQGKKFKNQDLNVDYTGAKSKNQRAAVAKEDLREKNLKKLVVMGLQDSNTINQIANLFPKACSITITQSQNRTATIIFHEEEDAAEALKANVNAKLNGRPLTVLYATELKKNRGGKKNKRRNPNQSPNPRKSMSGPPAKKIKKEESDDDDEDDDE